MIANRSRFFNNRYPAAAIAAAQVARCIEPAGATWRLPTLAVPAAKRLLLAQPAAGLLLRGVRLDEELRSPDVEQRAWQILAAGDDLADPYSRRMAWESITSGRWDVAACLVARPAGDCPASSAAPRRHTTCTRAASERGARHGASISADRAHGANARAGLRRRPRAARRDGFNRHLGAALLDALEAVARDRGFDRLRLDSSAFLLGDGLPHARFGYAIGPPYAGDADVDVWAEKDLRAATTDESP